MSGPAVSTSVKVWLKAVAVCHIQGLLKSSGNCSHCLTVVILIFILFGLVTDAHAQTVLLCLTGIKWELCLLSCRLPDNCKGCF